MSSSERVRLPLLGPLIPDGIRPGAIFVVEFDPDSQWLAVATTIAARCLQGNQYVSIVTFTRSPEEVKRDLSELGLDVPSLEKLGRLEVDDWYTATLTGGRLGTAGSQTEIREQIQGGLRMRSLKVADLSVQWLKDAKYGSQNVADTWPPGSLNIGDSLSVLLRFNEEKPFLEYMESRVMLSEDRRTETIQLFGFVRGIHSEWFYKRMEAASDGVIDIRVMEQEARAKDFLRIRSLKGQPRDSSWHEIEIKPSGEAVLSS